MTSALPVYKIILWSGIVLLQLILGVISLYKTSTGESQQLSSYIPGLLFIVSAIILTFGLIRVNSALIAAGLGFALVAPFLVGLLINHRVSLSHHLVRLGIFLIFYFILWEM